MVENIPELPSDDRKKYEWETRYKKDEETGKDPRNIMRVEALYLLVLFVIAFAAIVLNYKGVFTFILQVESSDVYRIQRIIYCMCAGLLGGVTFSIKIFYRAVARGRWNLDRRYWRIFSPLISLSVTSIAAAFMIDDILNTHIYWTYAIGYFAGYFSENAVGKMYDIAVILFSTPPEKNNDLEEMDKDLEETEKSKNEKNRGNG